MPSLKRKTAACLVLIVDILALILIIFGLYTRFSGSGNPVGSTYILVGVVLVFIAAAVTMLFISRRKPSRDN